jgi:nickel-dependent lactate racemase
MAIRLAFGRGNLDLELPSGYERGYDWRVLEARSAEALSDAPGAIQKALEHPVSGPSLEQLARGKRSATISVCDITRPVPYPVMLPPLLECLERAGIPSVSITIIVATGLHRPATQAEIGEILSPAVAGRYRVVNHHARDLREHRHLGSTRSGTPVYIDERFMAADLHITCGLIEPHLMLGFSGGRKLVAPGVAYQDTIKAIHSPRFMRDPKAIEGSIEGNTVHAELLEIARMARHDFMLDVSITRDRRISGVFAGEPEKTHAEAVKFVSAAMSHELDEPVDAAITSAAGYPLDLTFYQAIKGITAAAKVVKPGGKILLIAACGEGTGSPEFAGMLKEGISDQAFLDRIADSPVLVDQWQLEKLALVTRRVDVLYYVPGLPADYYPVLWGQAYATQQEALCALLNGLPRGASIAVMPEGPYVLASAASK